MRSRSGLILTVTGFLACPCHLPLTLPLLLALLGGTSLGLFLRANTGLVFAAAGAYFLVAIAAGLFLLTDRTRDRDSALCCSTDHASAHEKDRQGVQLDRSVTTVIRR